MTSPAGGKARCQRRISLLSPFGTAGCATPCYYTTDAASAETLKGQPAKVPMVSAYTQAA